MLPVTRHFVEVDGRTVHYRRCGQGPALILLHASPVSSRAFIPTMETWGQFFSCFAFDTPGNGLSSPLPLAKPQIADYAEAQVQILDQLGVETFIVYGRHTGASIAVEITKRCEKRVSLAMTDGYPVFSNAQRRTYLNGYLADLPTSEDGSHLAWIWSRYRDQFVFWPWNKKSVLNRADTDMPSIDFLNDGVIALMEAGNSYKGPYSAVFRHDAMKVLRATQAPVCITSRPGDSLFSGLANFPDSVWTEEMPRNAVDAAKRELDVMQAYRPDMLAPSAPRHDSEMKGPSRRFVSAGSEQLHVVTMGEPRETATVVLGPAPGSVLWYREALEPLSQDNYVIGIDLAACGESDPPANGNVSLMQQASRAARVLENLGVERYNLIGIGASASIALEIGRDRAAKICSMALVDPLLVSEKQRENCIEKYAGNVAANIHGTHMLNLWHQLRDALMWFPWFDQQRQSQIAPPSTDFDFEQLDEDFLCLFKHCNYYKPLWETAWRYPMSSAVQGYPRPLTVLATERSVVPYDDEIACELATLGHRLAEALSTNETQWT